MVEAKTSIVADPTYEKNSHIQQVSAIQRAECISDVSYNVNLRMPKGDWFCGRVTVDFTVKKKPVGDIHIDFRGVKVGDYTVNGQEALSACSADVLFKDHKLRIPTSLLKEGEKNHLEMSILNKYRKDGVGLHSFIDKTDSLQYLYTQFEADFCHFVFPCFDQPDLKAEWTFATQTEQEWTVISNEAEVTDEARTQSLTTDAEKAAALFSEDSKFEIENVKSNIFSTSFRISTYLYAIVAGPFGYHERQTEGLPLMRIYARASLVKDVNYDHMFDVTECGMHFYKDFFGREYPFRKYDQVFVPEHNYGAMENVGCVTYNENYLYRGENPTLAKLLRFSITNLHELAHMWFGNLVTMTWWNDLWLNESFATFMSFLAMSKSDRIKQYHPTVWNTFLQYKFWGISTDQLSSTHPICTEIAATDQAESLFDGISYGKGSAFLKQFYNILGYETMSKGLHTYFAKYQWKNTTLPDFVNCLDEAYKQSGDTSLGADFNLVSWCNSWLMTSGVNILEPQITFSEDGKLTGLKIKQSCGLRGKNQLRLQKLNVGIFSADGGDGEPFVVKDVVVGSQQELTDVDISSLPADFKFGAVMVNLDEHAYAKVRFDKGSIQWFTDNLMKVKNSVTRGAIWRYFWMLVIDQQMSSLKYKDFVQKQLPSETVEQITANGLMNLRILLSSYIPTQFVKETKESLFKTLVDLLSKEGVSKNPIVDQLFSFLGSKSSIETAIEWVKASKISIDGADVFDLGKTHKHAVAKILFKSKDFSLEFKDQFLEEVLGDDKTDLSEQTRATCRAGLPDPEIKAQIWADITNVNSGDSLYMSRAKMAGFYAMDQLDILEPYIDKFYECLPELNHQFTYKQFDTFFHSMLPRLKVEDKHIVKLVALKLQTPDTERMFADTLQDGLEILLRAQQIRALALAEASEPRL